MRSSRRRSGGLRGLPAALALAAASIGAAAEPSFYATRVAPLLDRHCVVCHGPDKQKAGLRLDRHELVLAGAESGVVVVPAKLKESELYRRITLPVTDEEVMPSDGKPLLTPDEVKVIALWIERGASVTAPASAFPDAPAPRPVRAAAVALAPDWRSRVAEIAALERRLGLRIVPRSQVATDGLVLRTASAPRRCDDAAIAALAPLAPFLVEAELARTAISDTALVALRTWENLRTLDLTRTRVTTAGLAALAGHPRLEVINLTDTAVDDGAPAALARLPALQRTWLFGTKAANEAAAAGR